ncbi:phosphatidylserine decarboxylase-domain-containing protein [Trichophaea hybrida]|nr:phosphatidylserine decarboxylase-domain-containing protein [Trichophaea hybrida]
MVLLSIPSRLQGRSKNASPATSRSGSPKAMNDSSLVLKASVNQGRNLAPKDKNGFSDPYLVVQWSDYRFHTETQPKTLNPVWNDAFDMPLSGASGLTMECVCWDKDRFGKDYMGEVEISLDEVFAGGKVSETRWFPLRSSRKKAGVSGEIQFTFALVDSSNESATAGEIYEKWVSWQSFFVQPPSPGSADEDPLSRDLGGDAASDDDEGESSSPSPEEDVSTTGKGPKKDKSKKSKRKKIKSHAYQLNSGSDVVGVIFLEISSITDLPPEKNVTRTGFDMDPFVVVSLGKKTFRTRHIRHSLNPVYDEKMLFQVLRHEQNYSLSFTVIDKDKFSSNDFVAETTFSVQQIQTTQPTADPETGLYYFSEPHEDMCPSGAQPTGPASRSKFRLPLSRSSSGTSLAAPSKQQLAHRTSSKSLRSVNAGQTDGANGLDDTLIVPPSPNRAVASENIEYDLKQYSIPLPLKHKDRWEDKHKPELHFKVKYVPYPALRQQFWRHMLRQYDSDDSGMISRVELTTMLDMLGSTLHETTINSFFERFREANHAESLEATELTMDQAVICLEDQLTALSKKSSTNVLGLNIPKLSVDEFKGSSDDNKSVESLDIDSKYNTPTLGSKNQSTVSFQQQPVMGTPGEEGTTLCNDDLEYDGKSEEHVIQIRECPLCHQPRMNDRSEMDIVTHLATCASQDWRQVDKLMMGGFVTSSQAQRKWYSKVISKISYGGYKLGANSANILVQDRITGLIQEERMSVYVRLGIRLLYKGLGGSSMEKKRIRKLLHSLSMKQGKKFDNPASARDIKGFIAFHQLDMSEVLKPLDEFKTFNEFFYRELKPGARPCSAPDNPKVIVSPADCRCVTFNRIDEATKIWIKGREFSVARLLGDAYPEDAKRFEKGALGIFRLAPQDYHRFHIPVDGVMGKPKPIKGEYYTVNPMAIRSALDVYGENVRVCVPIDSQEHGRVMVICVGAMMVGSTVITANPGKVARTDELGYFQFGGSTIILLFEPGRMVFDGDLVENSNTALETLVRVGMSIGHSPGIAAVQERKENITQEDMDDARRRIGGSLAPTGQ